MLALLLAATLATPLPTNPPGCVQYFHEACSEALGEWLPGFAFGSVFGDSARHIKQIDDFLYAGKKAPSSDLLGLRGPDDGTFFVYGDAGPPKGDVVYDYAHAIAFYDQGCCSWHESAIGYASAPPKRVVDRDLSALKTVRGIHLGMSPAAVEAIYGANRLRALPKAPGVSVLAYTATLKMPASYRVSCEQDDDFYFRDNRLVLIQLDDAC
jgi:hypothetical protein